MPYREKHDLGPSQKEIAVAKGSFGLAVILIVLTLVGAATFAQWLLADRSGMTGTRIGLLLLIWGGALFSALSGKIRSARFSMDRPANPKSWWLAYAWLTFFACIATYFVLKL